MKSILLTKFIESEVKFLGSLNKVVDQLTPIELGIKNLMECQLESGKYLKLLPGIEKLDLQDEDRDLVIFLLCTWCSISSSVERNLEAKVLIDHGVELLSKNTHFAIRSHLFLHQWLYVENRSQELFEKLLKDVLENCHQSNSYTRSFYVYMSIVSLSGLLPIYEKLYKKILDRTSSKLPEANLAFIEVLNNIESGNLDKVSINIPKSMNQISFHQEEWVFVGYDLLLRMLLNGPVLFEKEMKLMDAANTSKSWKDALRSLNFLLKGEKQEALQVEPRASTISKSGNFVSYSMIRAVLVNGLAEIGRNELKRKADFKATHFMDDYFKARIELIEGDQDAALYSFSTVFKACKKFGFLERLIIEIDLSLELKPNQVRLFVNIMHGSKVQPSIGKIPEPVPYGNSGNILIGSSRVMVLVKDRLTKFATTEIPVLIRGETGVGKDVVANQIHYNSARREEPFIAVNCGAITESLLQSELFGHEAGAFTGAGKSRKGVFRSAGKGTVFLDEIGEIHPALQVALLRTLENQEVRPVGSSTTVKYNSRVLMATNADLEKLVEKGLFRKDLYFRLKRIEVNLPPLKERETDVLELAAYFLNKDRLLSEKIQLSEKCKEAFLQYPWPGNIRELKNELEMMRLYHPEKVLFEKEDSSLLMEYFSNHASQAKMKKVEPEKTKFNPSIKSRKNYRRRREDIYDLFLEHNELTRSEIAKHFELSLTTITKDLNVLIEKGQITRVQPTPSPATIYFALNKAID